MRGVDQYVDQRKGSGRLDLLGHSRPLRFLRSEGVSTCPPSLLIKRYLSHFILF